MNRANRNRINAPIINRVVELNKYLLRISDRAFKLIKRNYIDAILKQGATLFTYAMRQLLRDTERNIFHRRLGRMRQPVVFCHRPLLR